MLPSPRSVSSWGPSPAKSVLNSVYAQAVVARVILLPANSVNHRLPSDAPMIPCGFEAAVGIAGHSVSTPAGVALETVLPGNAVNHMLPSDPAAIHCCRLAANGIENW